MRSALPGLLAGALTAASASAHDGVVHKTPDDAAKHRAETALPPVSNSPFPVDIGGDFTLVQGGGAVRSQADPDGHLQLLFFGYANCPSICAVALPMMAEVTRTLSDQGVAVRPVMITVDPTRDTVESISAPLKAIHPDFIGLTGTEAELQPVWDLYSIERNVVFEDPQYGEIFAHGSFIYLLDGAGEVQTVLPPVLSADRIAEIAARYAGS